MRHIQSFIYGAGRQGLSAPVLLDFTVDLSYMIYLVSSYQGWGVKARTVQVDNYSNPNSVSYTVGNQTNIIPAYSLGFIDVSKVDYIKFDSPAAFKMSVYILDTEVPEGFTIRSSVPAGLSSDPLISKVGAILHFEGIPGAATNLVNTAPNTTISGSILGLLNTDYTTAQKSAGDTSMLIKTGGTNLELKNAASFLAGSTKHTIEIAFRYAGTYSGTGTFGAVGFFTSATNSSNLSAPLIQLKTNAGTPYVEFISLGASKVIIGSQQLLKLNDWNYLAVTGYDNSCAAFLNGVAVGTLPRPLIDTAYLTSSGYDSLYFGHNGVAQVQYYLDEFRLTNATRYNSNYTPSSAAFFDY